mmetsp:Transcript_16133/g.46668  ORF Transcript_16133/g.46668 Transcript_16133/m.46668 type:complete len:253 (+) Transcript_16133:78-836(+)
MANSVSEACPFVLNGDQRQREASGWDLDKIAAYNDDETTTSSLHSADGSDEESCSGLDVSRCQGDGPCTAMIKNLFCRSSQESISKTLDGLGFKGKFDAIYVPGNPARKTNLGYAFVNFCTLADLKLFHRMCHGLPFDGAPATKPCDVIVSAVQGIRGPRCKQRKPPATRARPSVVEPRCIEKLVAEPQVAKTPHDSHAGAEFVEHPWQASPGSMLLREPPGLERFGAMTQPAPGEYASGFMEGAVGLRLSV